MACQLSGGAYSRGAGNGGCDGGRHDGKAAAGAGEP